MIQFGIYCTIGLFAFTVKAQMVDSFFSRWEAGIANDVEIVHDPNGNTFIGGYHYIPQGSGGSGSTLNAFVEKYNANGTSHWIVQSNSTVASNSVQFAQLIVDSAGNSYVSGAFSGSSITFGGVTYQSYPGNGLDFFVLKINASGQVEWITGADPVASFQAKRLSTHLTLTADQDILITGSFFQGLTLGDISLTGNTTASFQNTPYTPCGFIAKLGNDGHFQWAKQIEHLNSQESNGPVGFMNLLANEWDEYFIYTSLDSGVVIDQTMIVSTDTSGIGDMTALVKLDASGNYMTHKIFESPLAQIRDLTLDQCGNPIAVGDFMESLTIDDQQVLTTSARNPFVAKFNRDLSCQWLSTIGSTEGDRVGGIACNRQNEVFFNFDFWGTIAMEDTYTPSSTAILDVALVKLDANGNYVWSTHSNGSGLIEAEDVSVSMGDKPYMIGNFRNAQMFQGNSIFTMNSQHSDIYVISFQDSTVQPGVFSCGPPTSAGMSETEETLFTVYPNPANDLLTIEVDNTSLNSSFVLISPIGARALEFTTDALQTVLDVSVLKRGTYFLKHESSGKMRRIVLNE